MAIFREGEARRSPGGPPLEQGPGHVVIAAGVVVAQLHGEIVQGVGVAARGSRRSLCGVAQVE